MSNIKPSGPRYPLQNEQAWYWIRMICILFAVSSLAAQLGYFARIAHRRWDSGVSVVEVNDFSSFAIVGLSLLTVSALTLINEKSSLLAGLLLLILYGAMLFRTAPGLSDDSGDTVIEPLFIFAMLVYGTTILLYLALAVFRALDGQSRAEAADWQIKLLHSKLGHAVPLNNCDCEGSR